MTRDGGCSAQSVGLRVCFTHVVGQGCVVALPASQRLRRLLQNLVVLLGKQSKQAAQRERERGNRVRAAAATTEQNSGC